MPPATGLAGDVQLTVNGEQQQGLLEPQTLLLDYLRDHLELTGARRGCESGYCGACTVLLDGQPVHSCSVLAMASRGAQVQTIEGADATVRLLQEAFVAHGAIQCGYCTPGIILTAKALLAENSRPSEGEVRVAISGNLCRCTGYVKIVEAIQAVAAQIAGSATRAVAR